MLEENETLKRRNEVRTEENAVLFDNVIRNEMTIQSLRAEVEKNMKICNFEMESSALAGLASLLGHRAMTCCMVIANRYAKEMNTEYKNSIDTLIQKVLDRI